MAIEERLPPACAFAVSVLQERELDPEGVPEEAVEAAQQHLATCIRCLSSPPMIAAPRKKKKARRSVETEYAAQPVGVAETPTFSPLQTDSPRVTVTLEESAPAFLQRSEPRSAPPPPVEPAIVSPPVAKQSASVPQTQLPAVLENLDGLIDCSQCRELLPEYVEALDSGKNVAELYPEVHDHLLICDSGCLVLLDLFRQEAKATRKFRRRPVRDPFSAIGWEISGFFRTGHIPMAPMALSYGTLILLLLVASFGAYLGVRWDDARYYHPPVVQHTIPTPDGVGLSDGLHIYDACNADSYKDKRAAATALQQHKLSQANTLLAQAVTAAANDTSGCNGAEAAIYQEDMQVRQSGHPYGLLVVSFDSGPGVVTPDGGTDRHTLYAAYTQELVGAYISQNLYNTTQLKTPGAPLLYLVLANTTGTEQGALQVTNTIAGMATATNLSQFGLLVTGQVPLLGVLGLAPSSLLQVALPVLCRAGIPVISPTATGLFIINQLLSTSMYQHCASGFAFVRFSADDSAQSKEASSYAYNQLKARNAAVFYDPSNPSSQSSAQDFITSFTSFKHAHVVAQETAVSNGLLDNTGQPEASSSVLLAGLTDALQAKPDLIYAPMLTNDVITLAQALAKLPADQQPILMIGGEFVHPAALQELVQWARQQQLTLPRLYVSVVTAVRPPTSTWQKAFYASFCQSFSTPGSFCSGTAALDQGALLFADGVEMVGLALTPTTSPSSTSSASQTSSLPTTAQLVQLLSKENFAGVSGQVNVVLRDKVLITSLGTSPAILGIQSDGSLQIVG